MPGTGTRIRAVGRRGFPSKLPASGSEGSGGSGKWGIPSGPGRAEKRTATRFQEPSHPSQGQAAVGSRLGAQGALPTHLPRAAGSGQGNGGARDTRCGLPPPGSHWPRGGTCLRSGPISGQYYPVGAGGRCGAVRAGMDLGFFPIVLPSGLCHGTPPFPYSRRGLDAFPALSTAASSAHPPSVAGVGAAGYAAVPAADCQQPPGAACPGEAPPRPAASPCPGSGRPTSPEPERAFSCCPTPGAAPAKPRAFEWMRMKRSTPGRSEWGGGARAAATLLPAPPAQTPVSPLPSPPCPRRNALFLGVFRRYRRRGTPRLLPAHQFQHPAAHGAREGVSLQPLPVAGPSPRGGPLAAPPRRPGEGVVPESPHEAEEARAGGAARPHRSAPRSPGRHRLSPSPRRAARMPRAAPRSSSFRRCFTPFVLMRMIGESCRSEAPPLNFVVLRGDERARGEPRRAAPRGRLGAGGGQDRSPRPGLPRAAPIWGHSAAPPPPRAVSGASAGSGSSGVRARSQPSGRGCRAEEEQKPQRGKAEQDNAPLARKETMYTISKCSRNPFLEKYPRLPPFLCKIAIKRAYLYSSLTCSPPLS